MKKTEKALTNQTTAQADADCSPYEDKKPSEYQYTEPNEYQHNEQLDRDGTVICYLFILRSPQLAMNEECGVGQGDSIQQERNLALPK